MPIPKSIQVLVRQRGNYRCEYCHYPEILSTAPLSIEHTLPKSLGGTDDFENLALACRRCNEKRYNFTTGIDAATGKAEALFNPRQDHWAQHFAWSADGIYLIGTTPMGRATVNRLDLNDEKRQAPFIQAARQQWVANSGSPVDCTHPMMTQLKNVSHRVPSNPCNARSALADVPIGPMTSARSPLSQGRCPIGRILHWQPPIDRERAHYLYDRCVRVSGDKARRELGWQPRSPEQTLREPVQTAPLREY